MPRPPRITPPYTPFPYTTLVRSQDQSARMPALAVARVFKAIPALDRKPAVSTTADADPLKLNRLVQPLHSGVGAGALAVPARRLVRGLRAGPYVRDRKSTRLNSSH